MKLQKTHNYCVNCPAGPSGLEQIPEGAAADAGAPPAPTDMAHAGGPDKPKKEPLLARLSQGFRRRHSGENGAAAATPPVLAH